LTAKKLLLSVDESHFFTATNYFSIWS